MNNTTVNASALMAYTAPSSTQGYIIAFTFVGLFVGVVTLVWCINCLRESPRDQLIPRSHARVNDQVN